MDKDYTEEEKERRSLIDFNTPAWSFHNMMGTLAIHLDFFITIEGNFGFGTRAAKAGDLLCVFNNAPTVNILRPSEDGNGTFELVGEAYVHHMMHGEIDGMDIEEREITLV